MDPAPSWLDEPLPLPDEPLEDDPDDGILRGGRPEPGAESAAPPRDRGLATGVASREELAAKITDRLNPEQGVAVTMTQGPLLILAGAGSGRPGYAVPDLWFFGRRGRGASLPSATR